MRFIRQTEPVIQKQQAGRKPMDKPRPLKTPWKDKHGNSKITSVLENRW